jgi:hypothetical protein
MKTPLNSKVLLPQRMTLPFEKGEAGGGAIFHIYVKQRV